VNERIRKSNSDRIVAIWLFLISYIVVEGKRAAWEKNETNRQILTNLETPFLPYIIPPIYSAVDSRRSGLPAEFVL
jgi:hypothetical protein